MASVDAVEADRIPVRGDDMDTWETVSGKRKRAPVEGAKNSDISPQSLGTECRVGDLHLPLVADKEVVKEHAQWWRFERKEKLDTDSGNDPGVSCVLGGGGPALSARVAVDCNRASIRELTEEGERRARTSR